MPTPYEQEQAATPRRDRAFPETSFDIGSSMAARMSPIVEGRHEPADPPLNVERLNQECVLRTAETPIMSSHNYRLESGNMSLTGTTFTALISQLSLRMGPAFGTNTRAVLAILERSARNGAI